METETVKEYAARLRREESEAAARKTYLQIHGASAADTAATRLLDAIAEESREIDEIKIDPDEHRRNAFVHYQLRHTIQVQWHPSPHSGVPEGGRLAITQYSRYRQPVGEQWIGRPPSVVRTDRYLFTVTPGDHEARWHADGSTDLLTTEQMAKRVLGQLLRHVEVNRDR